MFIINTLSFADNSAKLLQIIHDNLVLEKRLETRLNNLTQENEQLQREVNQLREAAGERSYKPLWRGTVLNSEFFIF